MMETEPFGVGAWHPASSQEVRGYRVNRSQASQTLTLGLSPSFPSAEGEELPPNALLGRHQGIANCLFLLRGALRQQPVKEGVFKSGLRLPLTYPW